MHVHFGQKAIVKKTKIIFGTNTGLFKIIVGILTNCHTQYT